MLRWTTSCLNALLLAGAVLAAEQKENQGAPIQFGGGIRTKPTKLTMGKTIRLDAELKAIDVAKTWAVSVGSKLANRTDQKMFYSYQIAFFDQEKNLIGCQTFTHWVDPHKTVQAGTFISLSADQIDKIASYLAVFYESETQIRAK